MFPAQDLAIPEFASIPPRLRPNMYLAFINSVTALNLIQKLDILHAPCFHRSHLKSGN
jgi:hypothetical protein